MVTMVTMKIGDNIVTVNNSAFAPLSSGIVTVPNCYWQYGKQAFLYLPLNWAGCCQMVNLTVNNLVLLTGERITAKHQMRPIAQFDTLELITGASLWGKNGE